jgi:acetyl esterase
MPLLSNSSRNRLLPVLLPILLLGQLPAFAQQGHPTVEQVRAGMKANLKRVATPPADVFRTEIRQVWTGADSIPIQIYYPSAARNLPIVYDVHGGAFILLMLDLNSSRVLCNRTQSVVVSVDYRVAPEHPFPTSINDCYAVWNWIWENAEQIGGNRQKISLVGGSAGGLFIGALQVKRRQEGRPARPLAMVFINPGIDLRPGAPGEAQYRLVTDWYLKGADPNNPLVSPILNDKLGEYPPTLIITSEKDVLKPHGTRLAEKLKGAGVPTQLIDLPGVDHLIEFGAAGPKDLPAIEATVNFLNAANASEAK